MKSRQRPNYREINALTEKVRDLEETAAQFRAVMETALQERGIPQWSSQAIAIMPNLKEGTLRSVEKMPSGLVSVLVAVHGR